MGTNSKSTHQSYTVAPSTAATLEPSATAAGPEQPGPAEAAQLIADLFNTPFGGPTLQPMAGFEVPPELADPSVAVGGGKARITDEPPAPGEDAWDPPEPLSAAVLDGLDGAEGAAAGGAEMPEEQEEEEDSAEQPLTPVPEAPTTGMAIGEPVLVGGTDFLNSAATLISYDSADGTPREVLLAHVNEEAEEKLLDALALSEGKLVPVEVTKEITGQLELDKQNNLHELVAQAAKSVNHKLKNGIDVPQSTHDKITAAVKAVVTAAHGATADEAAMTGYYMEHLEAIAEKAKIGLGDQTYADGGKLPMVTPYLHTGMATVTEMVPAPVDDTDPGQLSAQLRNASRIDASLDPVTGEVSWDGTSRAHATGKEYAIDMGDGWSAVYRPYSLNEPGKAEFSIRGQLEVHAPAGAGHGPELVARLEQLHLANKPMTASEGEWTYLANNIKAQGLASNPQVKEAMEVARGLEELQVQELFHAHAHEAVGLDEAGLSAFAKKLQLQAAHDVLPKRIAVVRDAVGQAAGFADGAALSASPGYQPTPNRSGGWLTWTRFDVTGNPEAFASAWKGRSLVHGMGGGDITTLFATGVLASTERRAVMGTSKGLGMSEGQDKFSGGANSVFLRVRDTPVDGDGGYGVRIVWDDPAVLMKRSDYYAYNSDHFGALHTAGGKSVSGQTSDPMKIAKFDGGGNEVMFRDGIDLFGAEAPSRVLCGSADNRDKLLKFFADKKITHLAGKPVADIVGI
ncbi:hypothetical protein [Streptomyces sp. TLI_171]|uniref:hypothetical protein n=1 Tax=Streptomyces sp. TLI_171 TaxID=1938859 RepID=UPI000C18D665|nr:hypothetical protein [Streptomyces sp. TLI_171]RKE03013.1 hypothetical protein BX266_7620 [Streptomyces sp. TLI_171]